MQKNPNNLLALVVSSSNKPVACRRGGIDADAEHALVLADKLDAGRHDGLDSRRFCNNLAQQPGQAWDVLVVGEHEAAAGVHCARLHGHKRVEWSDVHACEAKHSTCN